MPDPRYLNNLRTITRNAPAMPVSQRQRLASLGGFAQREGVDIGMYGDRNKEGYGLMLEDLDARLPDEPAPSGQNARPFATPVAQERPVMFSADVMSPGDQFNHLQGMANQAMGAWENELDSRVAQSREMRRMQHEQQIERMRQEGLLRRLQAEQQTAMVGLRASDAARQGVTTQVFVPGRGFVPSWAT